MISVNKLSLFLGGRELYKDVSFRITKVDKIGLSGKNGAGKSTMLKLMTGYFKPTEGTISITKDLRLCYLPQELFSDSVKPIIEEVKTANAYIKQVSDRLDEINHQLETRTDYESDSFLNLLDELTELNDAFNMHGGNDVAEQSESILKGLGFSDKDLNRPMNEFSGGWQMRVELAKLLVQTPDVLLLDEPTNHLDIESIDWLENYLRRYPGAVLLISHDKQFLDNITNRTLEINSGKVYDYNCNYSTYLVRREEERTLQMAAQKNQQREIEHKEKLIAKYKAKASKAAFAQSLMKQLDKMDVIEIDETDASSLRFRFPEPKPSGKLVAEITNVGKEYPDNKIFKGLNFNIAKGEKIALIGKNGVGKSTFIKMMVQETVFDGDIKLGHNVSIGYFAQDEAAKLDVNKTVFETIDDVATGDVRKRIREILGSFLFQGDEIDKKVKVLSGGEKTRLALCKLLLEPYNFLILDEPTNHLDIISKEVLKNALQNYTGTLLLVSHDRDFLEGLSDRLYYIKDNNISIYFESVKERLEKVAAEQSELVVKKGKKKKEKKNTDYVDTKKLNGQLNKTNTQISNCEKNITKLENKILEKEKEVSQIDFTKNPNSPLFSEIEKIKAELDTEMTKWEDLEAKREELATQLAD